MNTLAQFLDDREERGRQSAEAEERWLREGAGVDPAERLAQWDRWLVAKLRGTFHWPGDAAAQEKLIRKCAAEVTVIARQLRGRGWLLEGRALAGHVQALCGPIAKAQQAGKIEEFWAYFRAAAQRYVGAHSDEIATYAKRTGVNEGAQTIGAILGGLAVVREASLTELIADRDQGVRAAKVESAKQRWAREQRAKARAEAEAGQMGLL